MKISELAKRTGVSTHALRHYERLGLLEPVRHANGYRDYTESMRREVVFIAMSRKIGFSLAAIAQRLPAYRAGRLRNADMVEALEVRVAEIDKELAALAALRAQVISHMQWLQKPTLKNPAASATSHPTRERSKK